MIAARVPSVAIAARGRSTGENLGAVGAEGAATVRSYHRAGRASGPAPRAFAGRSQWAAMSDSTGLGVEQVVARSGGADYLERGRSSRCGGLGLEQVVIEWT